MLDFGLPGMTSYWYCYASDRNESHFTSESNCQSYSLHDYVEDASYRVPEPRTIASPCNWGDEDQSVIADEAEKGPQESKSTDRLQAVPKRETKYRTKHEGRCYQTRLCVFINHPFIS